MNILAGVSNLKQSLPVKFKIVIILKNCITFLSDLTDLSHFLIIKIPTTWNYGVFFQLPTGVTP